MLEFDLPRKTKISQTFGGRTKGYEAEAQIQRDIAAKLSGFLPDFKSTEDLRILEIGCGTGFLTQHLIQKYPKALFHITDISPEMVAFCQAKFSDSPIREFFVLDGENPDSRLSEKYDLIVSSMAAQWFGNPAQGLKNLSRFGEVYYSTLGPRAFQEWRSTLDNTNAAIGLLNVPEWPRIFHDELIPKNYGSARNFLKVLKETGTSQPNRDYAPLPPKKLKAAMKYFDETYHGQITWHIVYGKIPYAAAESVSTKSSDFSITP